MIKKVGKKVLELAIKDRITARDLFVMQLNDSVKNTNDLQERIDRLSTEIAELGELSCHAS